jgi:SnoaL-like domain
MHMTISGGGSDGRKPTTSRGKTMSVHLPKSIERFLSSENALDPDVLAACFAPDGVVRDEGRTREGLKDIIAWRRETADKYRHTFEPLAVVKRDGKTIVATKVSGSFPGSPITLDFVFRLENGKIASLDIQS